MKLFAIYIGGEHPKAHIEVHDVRFVVAETIRDTYDQLRAEWWGTPGTLHIDCWAEIDHVDGHDVTLQPERAPVRDKLFFVNLGGYDGREFAERHRNLFVVATSIPRRRHGRWRPFRTGPTRIGTTCTTRTTSSRSTA